MRTIEQLDKQFDLSHKEDVMSLLKAGGVSKSYKPTIIREDGVLIAVMLQTRKPVTISEGFMKGCEIDIYDERTLRVWTSQKNKAMQAAREHHLTIRLIDGECELLIPFDKADMLIHGFGAKVKHPRKPNLKAVEALRQYRLINKTPSNYKRVKWVIT